MGRPVEFSIIELRMFYLDLNWVDAKILSKSNRTTIVGDRTHEPQIRHILHRRKSCQVESRIHREIGLWHLRVRSTWLGLFSPWDLFRFLAFITFSFLRHQRSPTMLISQSSHSAARNSGRLPIILRQKKVSDTNATKHHHKRCLS